MTTSKITHAVLAAEHHRCDCIRRQDFVTLRTLLHPELIHVHTRGNRDNRDSYLAYLQEVIEIIDVQREALSVAEFGDCAVMTGVQINTARQRNQEPVVQVKSQVMQVWVKDSDAWRLAAFQATPLGPMPPPLAR